MLKRKEKKKQIQKSNPKLKKKNPRTEPNFLTVTYI